MLIAASLVFYAASSWINLFLLIGVTVVNYQFGELIRVQRETNKTILWIAIGFNLAVLGYFKYRNFFLGNLEYLTIFEFLNSLSFFRYEIVLPLGISFYTFQQIAYLVDCSKPDMRPRNISYSRYLLFVSFFPQLIAGPIVHHRELLPQFESLKDKAFGPRQMFGCVVFAIGLGKKVLIADPLSSTVAIAFSSPGLLSTMDAWVGMLAYTFQLYFDFSGYSDMAVGLAALLGLRIPRNFNRPYLSLNVRQFWQRWHITLSRFLRDYLYIPLGGNQGSAIHVAMCVFVTMFIGGLWHGAGWTFVIWGLYHGVLVAVHRMWLLSSIKLPNIIAWGFTFSAICFGWVMFRSDSITDAIAYYYALFGEGRGFALNEISILPNQIYIAALLLLFWNERLPWHRRHAWVGALSAGLLIFMVISAGGNVSEFLYFRF
ncbi:MAG: MBOAT family protein [Gammaproteobacteria bacterium]|nr:MBOAT family protein [Gammaproteobacteria bacterium]